MKTTPGNLRFNRWSWAALALGVFCSALGAWLVQRGNEQQASAAVAQEARRLADTVLARIELYQYGLRGARGAVLTAGEAHISREVFHRYAQTRDIASEFPGARGFGFIRRVPAEALDDFLRSARAEGRPDFAVREVTPNPGERYVIQYLEPEPANLAAIGLDVASEPRRRQAAQAALRTGLPRLSAPITLVQASGASQQSFLMLLPIYRGGATPADIERRQAQAIGLSYAPLLMRDVLDDLHLDDPAVHFQLADVTDGIPGDTFYSSGDDAKAPRLYPQSLQRDVFGRRWQIDFSAHPAFVQRLHPLSPPLVFGAGCLGSLLLAALLGATAVSRQRRGQVQEQQARLAAIVESSADAIAGKNLQGEITSWNAGAQKLFGYAAEEVLGRQANGLLVPAERAAEEEPLLRRVARGERLPPFDTQRRHKDGRLIEVSLTASPILGPRGEVVGTSTTVRDITAQKAAEARIRELNSGLERQVAERTAELAEANRLLTNVLRSASEVSIIATDAGGVIRIFNRGAERLLGYRAEEVVGQVTPQHLHLEEELAARAAQLSEEYGRPVPGFRALVQKAEDQGAETREWTYVRKDGSRVPMSLVVTAIRDEAGQVSGYLGIAVDITERRAAEDRLRLAHDQLALAAEAAGLGIWWWRPADDTLHWNERMFELYQQPPALNGNGLCLEHWRERLHPEDVDATLASLADAVEGRGHYEPTFRINRPDGQVRYIQAAARVEYDADGTPLRVTGINLDITREREMQASLRQAKEQADAASAAKSSFLANMSHEIRTPMNAVLGMLFLARQTELNPRQRDYIDKAHSAANALLGLLNDILDYSKIEAGKLLLEEHPFELEALMRDLAVVLSGNLGSKDVEMLFDIDPNLPGSLLGDPLRLQQILINLAGNAIKFTDHGQVVVSVQQLGRTGERLRLRIGVRDSGIGIGPAQLQSIFDSFTQAEASTTRRFGGTGLGLFICKRLVELMGGRLQVESRLGNGSHFWFDLDLAVVGERPLKAGCAVIDRPLRLLVVDDNPSAAELLLRTCESLGWHADQVSGGMQAVARYREATRQGQHYDVVLMDWRMPDLDGLRAARLIQREAGARTPPTIIMITAYGREVLADVRDGDTPPFIDFLTKPVTPRQLADSVQQALGGEPAEAPAAPVASARRLAGRRLLVVEDNALNRQVAAELLASEGAEVLLAEGGLEGVEQVCHGGVPLDAVLMDVQMPDIDGLEATRRIRADGRFAALPILAMTANAAQSDREACLLAGMDDHIAKPIDKERLVGCLLAHLEARQPVREAPPQAPAADAIVESRDSVLGRFGGEEKLIHRVLRSFEPEMDKLLERLDRLRGSGDVKAGAGLLHTLKGSAGTMGASALAERCAALEAELLRAPAEAQADALAALPVDELRQLLAVTLGELQALFAEPPGLAEGTAAQLSRPQVRERLEEILALLESGNLDALDRLEALARHQHAWPRHFLRFNDLVQALDFKGALQVGREMLDEL
ncbi:PAS domain S-box-containing protein [Pseudomonas delhiensis]|uniref:Sensory/regulatory protein RpfC n=1 Tax=Pseudomonas delhiensis TaxID=366289 RepID=A0A239KHX4_9PSED|nr:PAS domain S-box protein [Pseudomonas delhiensis]SDJ18307.1 PAS domain S-box-containing protein [Pseudomonas delhiensis]SNT17288.1 PAS domain S-box-containing protein [Pseudomonas delhiensis]